MPNRILKESICRSDQINELTPFEEVMFYRLMVNADDYGRFDGRIAIIKNTLFPLKDGIRAEQIEKAIKNLSSQELVECYEVAGKPFVRLTGWDRHQSIRARKSKYPSPDEAKKIPANENSSNCKQLQANESNCMQMQPDASKCPRNPIQSESNPNPNQNPNPNPNAREAYDDGADAFSKRLSQPQNAFAYLEKCRVPMNGKTCEELKDFFNDGIGDDLVCAAADEAVTHGALNWSYVSKVLRSWQTNGVKTVEDVKQQTEKHRKETARGNDPADHRQDHGRTLQNEYGLPSYRI